MKHLKLFFALFAMLALGVGNAWGAEETLACPAGTVSNKTMTWDQTSCTIVHAQGNSTTALAAYSPWRIYKNSTVTFTPKANVTISAITITVQNTTDYKNATKNGTWDNATISMSSNTATITPTEGKNSIKFTSSSAQTRWSNIVITYTAGSTTQKEKYTLTYEAGSVTGSLEVEEGANLLDALEDITPVACDPTSTEPIGWSESEITTKQADAPTLLTDADVMPSEEHSVYYVFAKKETTGGAATDITIDLSKKDQITTNTTSSLVFTVGDVTFTNTKVSGSTNANNYCPGTTGKTYTSTRTYNGHQVTIASANTISKIVITAGTDSYATAIENATWTNATASANNTIVTITPNAGVTSVSFKPSATAGMTKVVVTTGGGTTTISDYTTSCSNAPAATLVSIAHTGDKTTFTEGDAFVKSTITATYSDESTLDVTELATFTGYNMNTTGTQTVTVTYEGKTTTYDITVSAKPTYTITWNNAGTTNETKVVQGAALSELPTVPECTSGKKFMGWTAATEVNNDGSGIVYVKETDIPTSDMTYYAVFAVEKIGEGEVGSADVTLSKGNFADSKITWDSDYATIVQEKVSGSTAVNGSYVASPRWYVGHEVTITPKTTINITAITINQGTGEYAKFDQATATNASIAIDGQAVTITPLDGTKAVVLSFAKQVRPTSINIAKGPATTYSDYSLNCDISVEPTWTISKNEIAFADKYVGFEYTETFTINASNLAEDIALVIDGSTFTVSPTSIAKDATFPQTVTVTYAPTAVGTHNATLNITSGSTLSKIIALTGSATEATIYTLTALADINPTDKVIIVGTSGGNTYAMSNDKGTSDAPDAIAVTVIDNKIATDKTNILWNIAKDGDNLTIYPANQTAKWLYCLADDNDGVRVGIGNAKEFTIDKGYLYATQTTTPRHIGIYSNSDWRCYKPSGDAIHTNIKDQSFAFYVLPNTDPSIDVNPESQDFVVALNGSASQEVEITAHNIAAPAYSTSISGDTYFTATVNAGKVTVTYAPTVVGEHAATLTITETTSSQTATVALTGKCVEAVDVATAMATDDNTIVALKPFEVVKVISAKNYVYIKDATGASLIFDYNDVHSMGSLVEGATVNGFVGKKGAYNKNPQLTPSVDYSALSVSGSGTAEATEITEVKAEDVNKFVVLKGVEITSNVNINTNPTLTVNGKDIVFRNQLERNFEFQADMLYDIYGFVGIYNETVQFWFLEAASAGSAIEYYTVTYEKGASDVVGDVPVDTKEYAEGETVILEPCELTREGYTFNGWNVTSTNGTVAVANNQFIMPGANVTITALWEEVKTYDQGAWVLVTDASELTVDDDVIIAAANENYALGKDQKSNNRGTGTIVKGSNVALLESDDVQILTLENGNQSGTLALSTGKGYLYAASSSSNYLRTETDLSDNSSWTIAINEGLATIKAQGTNTHDLLQYNSNSEIFSCYSSAQNPVTIYEYNPNERVITFDVNGGEAYAHTYVATTDGILIVPTEVPTHAAEGQLFDSWNDKQDGSGNTYNAGDIFSFSEHTVLYAQWTVANAYHVTYNIAGASGTTPVDPTHYYGGETVTLASQGDLVNPGHIFAGWKVVDATDTEIVVTDNTFTMPQSDVTATAKWVRQTNDQWVLVTDAAQLVVGEKYVIACNTHSAVAGNINTSASNPYMNKLDAAFSDDKQLIKALAPEAIVLTLGGTTDAWTFTNESGKALGATAAKKMAWDSGTTTWLLTFDANGALTMKNATDENGSLKYNSQNPRFTTYASGQKDIQLYALNPAQVVTGEKTDNDVPQHSNVTVENGGDLSVENTDTQYGDMYINNGGSVEVDENAQLTVNNLYIQTTMGTTTSGQLNTAPENLIVNGDAFIDITLGKNGDPSQWHAFTVPFPVDAMNGVYDLNDNKLTNEVNYAIMDYHGDLRANGQYGWKKYRGILVPGTFYLMTVDGARTTYRFKKVKDAELVAANTKSLIAHTGEGKDTDKGWNGVGNPTLMHGKVALDALILNPETYTYEVITASSAHYFTVGTPFFIQAAADATMTIVANTNSSLAPARRAAAVVEDIPVMLSNSHYTDRLYVSASEDATNEYEIGKDLAKMIMTNTPSVPQIFAQAYGTQLCMIDAPLVGNEATIALNLYAPADGEYTLSTEAQENATVYLAHEGTIVWNLSMGEYPITLNQGDNAGYSLIVRRENAPTAIDNILDANNQTEKLIYNGNLYILHEGKVFDAVGNMLK